MNIFITGATGYIGNNLAHTLAGTGHTVHALVRNDSKKHLLKHPNIKVVTGDILDQISIATGMKGCTQVYHTAAAVAPWIKDPGNFYKVNVGGTQHVLEAAAELGISKVVVTSSCGVFGPSLLEPKREDDPRITGFKTDYELSKKIAEGVVLEYTRQGMDAVLVYPAKVYGHGHVSHSLTANAVIDKFIKKKIAFIPSPGTYKACFCFIDDVVNGHVLAMQHGASGERYILGGNNVSYFQFFNKIRQLSGCRGNIINLSPMLLKGWALAQDICYRTMGKPPSFTMKGVDIVLSNYIFSSDKAIKQLGYQVTSLDEALIKTIRFLKTQHHE